VDVPDLAAGGHTVGVEVDLEGGMRWDEVVVGGVEVVVVGGEEVGDEEVGGVGIGEGVSGLGMWESEGVR
ncbi:hypothetical protein, partial [Dermacoccus nishinomiyaensis]|uniref:hypothetical protein n=1 Tax=Dermacoccus nishinomiyaensis TaxID=1274 RepID=UPI001C9311D5